jgi:hypothetical protein
MCVINLKGAMEAIYMELLTPELVNMTKPKFNKLISYGYFFTIKLVYSLVWIYKYYFEEPFVLFLPVCVNIEETLEQFNEHLGEFVLTQEEICHCTLETIEMNYTGKLVIFGYADFIFNEILNKRRLNTRLKTFKRVHVVSYTSLHFFDLRAFDLYDFFEMKTFPTFEFNYIDLLDIETYDSNVESLVEFISERSDKSIYLSFNMHSSKIKCIEQLLQQKGVPVSRKETSEGVVIHSSKSIKLFLKNTYDIYIFICQKFENPMETLYYLKEIDPSAEIYFDEVCAKSVNSSMKRISTNISKERMVIKDSDEFESYTDLLQHIDQENSVVVSEKYYNFDAPANIQKLNVRNLTKQDYDVIRHFIKTKLQGKLDLDIKTCQLSTPCSPKDRSKKLNSLSNKISSSDYRCDVTCELFRNYTIGVVLWNEMFSSKRLVVSKNQTYIYQTTSGSWKYTTVN